MLTNDTSIGKSLKVIADRHDAQYARRSHVHWFVGEGMESGEFSEKRENFATLI